MSRKGNYEHKISPERRIKFSLQAAVSPEMVEVYPRARMRKCNRCPRHFVSLDYQFRRCPHCTTAVGRIEVDNKQLDMFVGEEATTQGEDSIYQPIMLRESTYFKPGENYLKLGEG